MRLLLFVLFLALAACERVTFPMPPAFHRYTLGYDSPVDPAFQSRLESLDGELRARFQMMPADAAVGLLDLRRPRLAMIHPDRIEYAASVAKIGILLAYFEHHPDVRQLNATVREDLGLMAKASSNEKAAKFSREIGLREVQQVLDAQHFYDRERGGGLWVGKHYGAGSERHVDPVGKHSHAATVRQLLRFYLLLEQGRLVSPAASATMREIFLSPAIPHDAIKFVKALGNRPGVEIARKWGTWQDWRHDTAIITGAGRHYILVALTHHPQGDEYLEALARAVDDQMIAEGEEK